jgi:hypothetical protein
MGSEWTPKSVFENLAIKRSRRREEGLHLHAKINHTHTLKLRTWMITGGVAITLYVRIMEVFGSNLGQGPSCKCRDNTSISSWPPLPSESCQIHQSSYCSTIFSGETDPHTCLVIVSRRTQCTMELSVGNRLLPVKCLSLGEQVLL